LIIFDDVNCWAKHISQKEKEASWKVAPEIRAEKK
jgi:hypothetical protein